MSNTRALWDVLHACQRAGSLDSAIVRQSEEPNDFAEFFAIHPKIERVCFNGGTAAALFKRHCKQLYASSSYEFIGLPSTSPANAGILFERQLAAWKNALID
jgi:double-stranded uracil-DNA glycosylase